MLRVGQTLRFLRPSRIICGMETDNLPVPPEAHPAWNPTHPHRFPMDTWNVHPKRVVNRLPKGQRPSAHHRFGLRIRRHYHARLFPTMTVSPTGAVNLEYFQDDLGTCWLHENTLQSIALDRAGEAISQRLENFAGKRSS